MSARVTALVWARYGSGSGELLLALALADQCNDGGEYIAIDIARLAKKTRQADRTVREQLQSMVADGWLEQMDGSKAFRVSADWLGGAQAARAASDGKKIAKRASRLTEAWTLPAEWREWSLEAFPAWTADFVASVAERFRDHWISASGQSASKMDWFGVWRNWCRKEPAVPPAPGVTAGAAGGQWWLSAAAIERKGGELEVARIDGELFMQWRDRIFRAAGAGPWEKLMYKAPSAIENTFKSAGHLSAALANLRGASSVAGEV
ncbi:hypothetical protein LXA47_03780 [Massilia sp. P8910]|uniref:hypothetical protein n=1 Tax=Massilia antarctica TaxID=2765360 RepID=UPI001E45C9A4|nr:hypothetical protein [Massilia antarctica]MCE3602718.1 hypothetical protein [Massilia antarctica]